MISGGTNRVMFNVCGEEELEYSQLLAFIEAVDGSFPTALSDKVSLADYTRKLLSHGTLCAAIDEKGKIAALCAGYTKNTPGRYAYISAVAALPDYVGRGLASCVVEAFEARSQEAGLLGIHCYAEYVNKRAMRMWNRLGYIDEKFISEDRPDSAHFLKIIRKTVLVTALGSMSCAATIASLEKAGYRIIGCDIYNREWIANALFVDAFYQVPPAAKKEEYLESLASIVDAEKVGFILPSTDAEVDALINLESIGEAIICLSGQDSLQIARNKLATYGKIKNAIGPAAIPTKLASDFNLREDAFPLICKPLNGRSSQGLFRAYSLSEFEEFFAQYDPMCYCIQPLLEGRVVTVDVVRQADRKKQVLLPRREYLRTYNGAGLSVEVLGLDERLADLCTAIANILDMIGCFNLEFIEDDHGNYRFLECNPRFSGGLGFSQKSGYDCVLNHLRCFQDLVIEDLGEISRGYFARRYEEYRIQ